MRLVRVASLDREVSAIGFGCASLGSRVSAASGRRALDCAFAQGVTWYDVAPPYGDGLAEGVLGGFVQGRRDRVVICTKFGIARPTISRWRQVLRPVARALVDAMPVARGLARRGRAGAARAPIEPAEIEASLRTSLRYLRTDYVDVFALHDPSPQEAADGRIFDALTKLKRQGLIRAISIAGSPDSAAAAAAMDRPIDFVQIADDPLDGGWLNWRYRTPAGAVPTLVTHSVLSGATLRRLSRLSPVQRREFDILARRFEPDPKAPIEELLLARAFSGNPTGIVILSMLSRRHIERNCAIAARTPAREFSDELRRILDVGHLRDG